MIETSISKDIWKVKYRNGGESEVDFYKRISNNIFNIDKAGNKSNKLFTLLKNHQVMFAGRILMGIGTDKVSTLSNCFVLPIRDDSMVGIMKATSEAAITLKSGGGIGYNFSILRPRGANITSTNTQSSGTVSFMSIFDSVCSTIRGGGNRRGAQMGILSVYHPDILEFIDAKSNGGLTNFNMSVLVDDKFMNAVVNKEKWSLIFPDIESSKYKERWNYKDLGGLINKWEKSGLPVKLYKTVNAVDLYNKIVKSNWEHAEPGIVFEDSTNKNPTSYCQYLNCTNPCGEIALQPYGSCNLGMINLSNFVLDLFTKSANFHYSLLDEAVQLMVEGLDNVLDINTYPIPEMKDEVINFRQIGLGITGLGDMLAMLGVKYGSVEGRNLAETIMKHIKIQAYKTSVLIAKDKGEFPKFNVDNYFESGFMYEFLDGDTNLINDIKKYGIGNSKLLAIAPTGTTSLLMNNVSSGIEPIFNTEYVRTVIQNDNSKKDEVVRDYAYGKFIDLGLDIKEYPYFQTAEEIEPIDHLKMQSVMQGQIDSSISKTINLPSTITINGMKDIYMSAYKLNLKGCTTYRPNSSIESVISVKKKITESPKLKKLTLTEIEPSRRYIVHWNSTKIYLNVVYDDNNNPRELFVNLPFSVGMSGTGVKRFNPESYLRTVSDWTAISRLTSLLLRYSVPVDEIIKQFQKSTTSLSSLSNIIERVLRKSIDKGGSTKTGKLCSECGIGHIVYKEGCSVCPNCGFSSCG